MRGPPGGRGRSRRTGSGRRRRAASRARGRAPRRHDRRSAAGRQRRCRDPGRTHQGRSVTRAGGSWAWAWALAADAARGVHRFGPSSTSTPRVSMQPGRCGGDLGDRALEGLAVAGAGHPVAADLADVLAGGGLQFARRRRLVGATQGLDASAHARTVRPPGYPRHDGSAGHDRDAGRRGARHADASGRRLVRGDVASTRGRRPAPAWQRDPLPAGGRRALALASARRRRGLAMVGRRSARAPDLVTRRSDHRPSPPRPRQSALGTRPRPSSRPGPGRRHVR